MMMVESENGTILCCPTKYPAIYTKTVGFENGKKSAVLPSYLLLWVPDSLEKKESFLSREPAIQGTRLHDAGRFFANS